MCGRFVGFRKLEELKKYIPIDKADFEISENYNVAPSQEVFSVIKIEALNTLEKLHWGLVPFWAKDKAIGNKLINARSETAAIKPSFRDAFKKRRCLILADGYYEWKGEKGAKQPYFITLPDGSPFVFAGLWETWDNQGQNDTVYKSCTILTTEASASIREIHHRMPVVLEPNVYEAWLDPDKQNVDELQAFFTTDIIRDFINWPVSKDVNMVKANKPSNIQKTSPEF
ncbi:MAG: SOS response-associated peptidase [Desulfobacteraceae bacterium]|nr:MAG: SOS response-associated peptidase [Desulfobacteraceae bacterium]